MSKIVLLFLFISGDVIWVAGLYWLLLAAGQINAIINKKNSKVSTGFGAYLILSFLVLE